MGLNGEYAWSLPHEDRDPDKRSDSPIRRCSHHCTCKVDLIHQFMLQLYRLSDLSKGLTSFTDIPYRTDPETPRNPAQ